VHHLARLFAVVRGNDQTLDQLDPQDFALRGDEFVDPLLP
jgi:hypothetical protein